MARMPKLPVEAMCADCDEREARLIRAAFNSRTDCLRATKPFRRIDFEGDEALFEASANYVWRMLCFDFCGFHPHNCMPVCADWDIGRVCSNRERRGGYADSKDRRADEKAALDVLDALVKQAESVLPITAQAGVMQWRRAF